MQIRHEIIEKLLSGIHVNMLVARLSAKDAEYEYILDGIEFNLVSIELEGELKNFNIYDKHMARFFQHDFISNASPDEMTEAIYLHYLREKFIEVFEKAEERGYNEFKDKVEQRIRPYQNTDARVTQTIWRILNEATYRNDNEIMELNDKYVHAKGYKNGLIRRAAEFICDFPDMFFGYTGLLIKYKAIDTSKSYYFSDAFWSRAAFDEAIETLSPEFLSEDGKSWNYRQKGNKTAFIALFEELFVKDYLKKRLSVQEIRNIAQNSFDLEISERTFNEAGDIIKAQSLFKHLTRHKRYIDDEPEFHSM